MSDIAEDLSSFEPGDRRRAPPSLALRVVLVAGACILTYAPVVVQEYGFTDDYAMLNAYGDGAARSGLDPAVVMGGRPLYAMALLVGFRATGTLAHLGWLRLVGVLGLAALAWGIGRHAERHGWSPFQGIAISLACIALPGPMLFACWGICFVFPWALVLAGLSFVATERASGASAGREQVAWLGLATAILTCSFLTYQPAAPTYWLFFALAFFAPGAVGRRALAARALVVFGGSAALGLVAVALGKRLHPSLSIPRATLGSDPLGKLRWFAESPLVEAWNFVWVQGSVTVALAVGLFTAIGLVLASRRAGIPPWLGVVVGAALLLVAYAPNLTVAENFASFRSEVSLSLVAAGLAAIAMRGWATIRAPRERALTAALAAVAAAFLMAASFTSQRYVVRPQTVELSWLRSVLNAPAPRVLVIPRGAATVAPLTVHDELGFPTITTNWSAKVQVAVIMRERGYPVPQVVFADGTDPAAFRAVPGTVVVDTAWLTAMRPDVRL